MQDEDVADAVPCPLSGCSSTHPVHEARNRRKTPYLTCGSWGNSTIFLRGDLGDKWLRQKGGGTIPSHENPLRTVESVGSVEDDYLDVEAQPNPSPDDPGVSVGRHLPWLPQPEEPAGVTQTRSKALEQFESLAGPLREEKELWRQKRLALERELRSGVSEIPEEQEELE